MKTMQDDQMIFMISLPRSGSTLLQKILGGHSDVYTRSEPWLLLHPLYALKRDGIHTRYNAKLAAAGLRDFISNIPEKGESLYYGRLRNFYLSLYSAYLDESGKSRFLDKTPRYYEVFDELQRVFPNAKFIIIYRNPLAVLSSILDTWVKDDYRKLKGYKSDLYTGAEFLRRDFSKYSNTHIVRYEELLSSPTPVAERLFDFLQLPRQLDCIEYGEKPSERWMYGDPVTVYENSRPDSKHIDAWKRQLDNPQRLRLLSDYLQGLGKECFKQLGYDFDEMAGLLSRKMSEQQEAKAGSAEISLKSLMREDGEKLQQLAQEKKTLVARVSSLTLELRTKVEHGSDLKKKLELCDSQRLTDQQQLKKLESEINYLRSIVQEHAGLLEVKEDTIRLVRENLQAHAVLLEAKDSNLQLMRESQQEYAELLELKDQRIQALNSQVENVSSRLDEKLMSFQQCKSELDLLRAQLKDSLQVSSNANKQVAEKSSEIASLMKLLSERDTAFSNQALLAQEQKVESGRLMGDILSFVSAVSEVCRYRVFMHPMKKLKAYKELLRVYQGIRGARKYN
ncbi:sulfotransferase family protein [Pseudomonas nitroreducens]|uniref:sulfotransferase family protein n=1 Tax=Pseudomonas nitroreducens TaxID=46680 RepID=UPI00265A060F|nr:sulfotransferase [Pseudomonas nitroreducens]MCP1651917.1 hypothetical protein [Pseudomonas nitroreducens]MCP1689400.1 hypothetical protein [Pseudomonas nitroreducens]